MPATITAQVIGENDKSIPMMVCSRPIGRGSEAEVGMSAAEATIGEGDSFSSVP